LIQSARLNGHDPYVYLKDVLTRLPTQRASEIEDFLPHTWKSVSRENSLRCEVSGVGLSLSR